MNYILEVEGLPAGLSLNNVLKNLESANVKFYEPKNVKIGGVGSDNNLKVKRLGEDEYLVREFYDKKGVKETFRTIIPRSRVVVVYAMITSLWFQNDKECFSSKKLWRSLIDNYGWDVDINAFNGGKYRRLYYFPYFYYPVKILEDAGLISYHGGVIGLFNESSD